MPIIFNGQTYNSVEDMPPDARQAYDQAMGMLADKNKDGMPDAMEQPAGGTPPIRFSTKFTVNGQTMQGLENLPPETRQAIEQAMNMLDTDHNGVPDFLERNPALAQFVMNGQMMKHFENLPPEKRQVMEQLLGNLAAKRAAMPNFGAAEPATPSMPAMGAGMPAPIQEPPMLAMAPQIPMPSQSSAMTPMMKNVVEDPDAGRRTAPAGAVRRLLPGLDCRHRRAAGAHLSRRPCLPRRQRPAGRARHCLPLSAGVGPDWRHRFARRRRRGRAPAAALAHAADGRYTS